MNMILLSEQDFMDPHTVVIDDRRHQHISLILKPKAGDRLKVGLINGQIGTGCVLEIGTERTMLRVSYERCPPPKIPVTVIMALPRPPVFRRMVSALTAMGVERMFFIQTARVEKSYWSSPALEDDHVHQAVVLGLEQSQDTRIPEIFFEQRFKPFMDDIAPGIFKGRIGLVAHPQSSVACPANVDGNIVLVVGPEGGLTDGEVEIFCAAGCQRVSLGPRILRFETALQALVGRVMTTQEPL